MSRFSRLFYAILLGMAFAPSANADPLPVPGDFPGGYRPWPGPVGPGGPWNPWNPWNPGNPPSPTPSGRVFQCVAVNQNGRRFWGTSPSLSQARLWALENCQDSRWSRRCVVQNCTQGW